MSKKKTVQKEEEIDDIPDKEEINLEDWDDDLEEETYVDLSKIEDEMLSNETDKERAGRSASEIEKMLKDTVCVNCLGSSSKRNCSIRTDYGCPPDKANK
ncbi:hypothetical protein ES706_03788 [subsurface metagenome]